MNKISNKEFRSTQTNSVSCYTSLQDYGAIPGNNTIIVPPIPVIPVPQYGNLMRPYKMPNLEQKYYNCSGYNIMDNLCQNNEVSKESYTYFY